MSELKMLRDAVAGVVPDSLNARTEKCDIHGEFESKQFYGTVWSRCPECTRIEKEERLAKEKEEEGKRKQAIWESKLGNAGIPERFTDRTLDKYKADSKGKQDALKFAMDYANEFDAKLNNGRCAVFCGQPGTGKTHLSVGIGLDVLKKGHTVVFTTVQRMIRKIKDTWRKDSNESESDAINLFSCPDLLIIDEIGVQFGSEFEKNAIFDILNERYENRMPTLLLSNLSPSEVKAFLGERVFDRLREDGGQVIPFNWDSYRGV